MRTDQYRFADPNYVRQLLGVYYGGDEGPLTPDQQKQIKEEMLQFGEFYKGILDILANLAQYFVVKAQLAVFVSLVVKTGANPRLFVQVMGTTLALVREGRLGIDVIQKCAEHGSDLGKKLSAINSNAGKTLCFLVALQVGFHLIRGDYAKAVAEIGKTALCGLIAPMALIDLVDSIIGFALPTEWAKFPPIRVIRGMNPAQCSAVIIENISTLAYVFTMAKMKNWTKVMAGIEKICTSIESSPVGIFTYLSRDTALLMDELVLPAGVSKFEIFGASIRNLADFARANPHNQY